MSAPARLRRLKLLGSGSCGEVWRCRDPRLGIVAVKYLRDDLAPEARERMRREHHVLAAVRHRNVVTVLELREQPRLALILELVDGLPLLESLATAKMTLEQRGERWFVERLTGLLLQLLDGLAAVHEAGLVHRDIKPGNVLVTTAGVVKLLDLGMAAGVPTGTAGTLRYMAPEMLTGAGVDQRADLYAVGAIAYEALTGDVPHGDASGTASALAFARKRANDPATAIESLNPAVPATLGEVIARLIAREPRERPTQAAAAARSLARAGAQGDARPTPRTTTSPVAPVTLLESPLVRREHELTAVTAAAARAFAGHGSCALAIVGEGGSGKTRLAESWARGLESQVLVLRANGRGEQQPFAAFTGAIEEIVFALATLDPRKAGTIVPRRARCLEPLSRRVSELPGFDLLPPLFALGDDAEPARIIEVATELVSAMTTLRPVVLLADEVDAMGPGSRHIVRHLARARDARLSVVTIAREPPETDFERDGRITLGNLDDAAFRTLVSQSLDAAPTPAFLAWVRAKSGGNPGAAIDALTALLNAGAAVHRAGFVDLDQHRADRIELGAWAMTLLESLDDDARRVATALAILDEPAELTRVVVLTRMSVGSAARGLQDLLRMRVIEETPTGVRLTRMTFRDALLAALEPKATRRLHQAVAREAELNARELVAITHRLAAGEIGKVLPRLGPAAERVLALGDSRRAHAWTTAGLEELGRRSRPSLVTEAALRIARARAALHRADVATWESDLARVDAITTQHPIPLAARANLLDTLRDVAYRRGEAPALVPRLAAHLEDAIAAADRPLMARAHEGLASALLAASEPAEAKRHLTNALRIYRDLGDQERMGRALSIRGVLDLRDGAWPAAERHLRRALAIARRHRAMGQVLNLLGNLSGLYHTMGRTVDAINLNRELIDLARGLGDHMRTAQAQSNFGTALMVVGQYGAASTQFDQAETGLRAAHNQRALPGVALGRGALLLRVGDYAGARRHLDDAVATINKTGFADVYRPKALFLRAEAWCGTGDFTAATHDITEARDHGRAHHLDWTEAEAEFLRALIAADRGDLATLHDAARAVVADAERRHDLPLLSRARALIALHRGDVTDARSAVEVATQSGDVAAELEARAALVATLSAAGDEAEAERERALGAELAERVASWCGPHRESFLALAHVRRLTAAAEAGTH